MKTCPCKDCKERSPACHGDCEKFAEWKKPIKILKAEIDKERMIDDVAIRGGFRRLGRKYTYKEI